MSFTRMASFVIIQAALPFCLSDNKNSPGDWFLEDASSSILLKYGTKCLMQLEQHPEETSAPMPPDHSGRLEFYLPTPCPLCLAHLGLTEHILCVKYMERCCSHERVRRACRRLDRAMASATRSLHNPPQAPHTQAIALLRNTSRNYRKRQCCIDCGNHLPISPTFSSPYISSEKPHSVHTHPTQP